MNSCGAPYVFITEMRRERKKLLRANLINDIVARWQTNELTEAMFKTKMTAFKNETDSSGAEMTQIGTAIEEQCIQYVQRGFATSQSLKNPSLPTLCRHLYDHQHRPWEVSCLLSRIDEFYAILIAWRKHYVDTIMATVVAQYTGMLERGASLDDLYERVEYHDDVYHNVPSPIPGMADLVHTWPAIDNRLRIYLDNLNMVRQRALRPRHVSSGLQLAGFVKDKQNVHTGIISKQMNDTLAVLFALPVPAEQKTLQEIWSAWIRLNLGAEMDERKLMRQTVHNDMQVWGKKSLICKEGDYLYRRVLQHLWARMKGFDADTFDELVKRLYEECFDALRMCAHGHVSRLTNVLVGFDMNIRAGVSLQDKMAEIARRDATEDEKREAAVLVMNEYGVPEEGRVAWLDAF